MRTYKDALACGKSLYMTCTIYNIIEMFYQNSKFTWKNAIFLLQFDEMNCPILQKRDRALHQNVRPFETFSLQ